jgi:hypothetical protein
MLQMHKRKWPEQGMISEDFELGFHAQKSNSKVRGIGKTEFKESREANSIANKEVLSCRYEGLSKL